MGVVQSLVVSDSWRPSGLQPARLLCPWDFPGKNTGVRCHSFPSQEIIPTQEMNPGLLHCRRILDSTEAPGVYIYSFSSTSVLISKLVPCSFLSHFSGFHFSLQFSQHFGFKFLSKMLIQLFLYLIGKDFCLFTSLPQPLFSFLLNQHHCLHYSHLIFYSFLNWMVSCDYVTILIGHLVLVLYTHHLTLPEQFQ